MSTPTTPGAKVAYYLALIAVTMIGLALALVMLGVLVQLVLLVWKGVF